MRFKRKPHGLFSSLLFFLLWLINHSDVLALVTNSVKHHFLTDIKENTVKEWQEKQSREPCGANPSAQSVSGHILMLATS